MSEAVQKQAFAATIRARADATAERSHRAILLSLAQMLAPIAANENAPEVTPGPATKAPCAAPSV